MVSLSTESRGVKEILNSLVHLESFSARLLALAHATSTQKNITAHIRSYHKFCELRALEPFPISVRSGILYIAYLVAQNRTYGTILNHLSSLKHAHQLAGYELTWSSDYRFQLLLRGAKRFLGQAVSRKSAITPSILHAASALFNFSIPLHATMWALFLVAFFTFLRKSNLVPDNHVRFPLRLSHGKIWSSLPQALTFMFPLQRLFSATNALLFCPFPRFPGLVFARFPRYVAIYPLIPVLAQLLFFLFYRGRA